LRGWAEELLDGARIRREGLLHSGGVQACWQQHLSGRSDRSGELWAILMVQAWLDSARESKLPLPAFRTGQAAAELEATTTDRTGSLRAYG
jgi:asparagine synthase (glutamine-hydrolysing)